MLLAACISRRGITGRVFSVEIELAASDDLVMNQASILLGAMTLCACVTYGNFYNLPMEDQSRFARCQMPVRAIRCPGLSNEYEARYCVARCATDYASKGTPSDRRRWLLENGCPPAMVYPERYLAGESQPVSTNAVGGIIPAASVARKHDGFDPQTIGPLTSAYDEFRDRTTTSSAVPVGNGVTLYLFAISRGRSPSESVTTLRLGVGEESDKSNHAEYASLIFLIDGRRVVARNLSRHIVVLPEGRTLETISTSMSLDDLKALSNATLVRAQLDSTEFSLAGQARDHLRAFAVRIGAVVPAPMDPGNGPRQFESGASPQPAP